MRLRPRKSRRAFGPQRADRRHRHGLPLPRPQRYAGRVLATAHDGARCRHRSAGRTLGHRSLLRPDPSAPGKMATRHGAFLERVDQFDAAFFGIAPRRPRLDRNGSCSKWRGGARERPSRARALPPVRHGRGRRHHLLRPRDPGVQCVDAVEQLRGHGYGRRPAVVRAGLTGPSMAIDTACSSSLVCLRESLRSRETGMALAGGVNLICRPRSWSVSRRRACCRRTDAARPSTRRRTAMCAAKAAAWWVLKRLACADDGDRVLGIVRGTAIGRGGAGGGLTVPSRDSQERVIRRALNQAGLTPGDVSYVEAHGTGTSLGDPIEVEALAGVYGAGARRRTARDRFGQDQYRASESASIAGLIKVLLSFEHDRIPAHLHFTRPNPHTPWQDIDSRRRRSGRVAARERRRRRGERVRQRHNARDRRGTAVAPARRAARCCCCRHDPKRRWRRSRNAARCARCDAAGAGHLPRRRHRTESLSVPRGLCVGREGSVGGAAARTGKGVARGLPGSVRGPASHARSTRRN